jgi:glyoxylase-like metal-dependent hydrolase (beta-lactamase superfamily II)
VIHTPGHRTDHLSYGLHSSKDNLKYLFPGDTILGSESVCFISLELYMADLHRLLALNFDHICLVHTCSDLKEDLLVPAKPKIEAYIAYRREREDEFM